MFLLILLILVINCTDICVIGSKSIPMVIHTWSFTVANKKAWAALLNNVSALDAVEIGCYTCEKEQCDHAVGWGGTPDENGETTLDAMIMDGPTHSAGAVASLRRVKSAISVARKVMENTEHTLLVGDLATKFALKMGFKEESLTSKWSMSAHNQWKQNKCQPNFWTNVKPNSTTSCGPYTPIRQKGLIQAIVRNEVSPENHDTITMIAIDRNGSLAIGATTNGLMHKIPGVGDAPIPGAGAYVDQDYGAAVGTGIGDLTLRLLPTYQAVQFLRQGMDATTAAKEVINRLIAKFPIIEAAIVVADNKGGYGAACVNIDPYGTGFPYSVANPTLGKTTVIRINCISTK